MPGGFVSRIGTIEQRLNQSLVRERLLSMLAAFFAGLALTLACIGLYGIMADGVVRRTREIEIRIAIRARQTSVIWMVVRDTLVLVLAGAALGAIVSFVAARYVTHQLFGVAPGDPLATAVAILLLLLVAMASGYLPARRASRINPVTSSTLRRSFDSFDYPSILRLPMTEQRGVMLELRSMTAPCLHDARAGGSGSPPRKGDNPVNVVIRTTSCIALLLLMGGAVPAAAQQTAQPAVTLQATGSFANSGSFAGTLTINRFEQRGGQIVAIGVVQGTLSRANRVIGTALATEVTWPVRVSAGGGQLASATSAAGPQIIHVRWPAETPLVFRPARVQAQGCTPLQVNLGATNVNLLGLQVALDPVGLTLSGTAGTPLGDLVCAASDLLGNVAGLVTLLSNLLGVLTGLLGGVTGALGGIV